MKHAAKITKSFSRAGDHSKSVTVKASNGQKSVKVKSTVKTK